MDLKQYEKTENDISMYFAYIFLSGAPVGACYRLKITYKGHQYLNLPYSG